MLPLPVSVQAERPAPKGMEGGVVAQQPVTDPPCGAVSVTEERLTRLLGERWAPLGEHSVGAGVLAGLGSVGTVPVVGFATDPSVRGGSLGTQGCAVILDAYRLAVSRSMPIIGIWHSGGARLDEGASSLDAIGRIFSAMTRASGIVPQISVVLGPAAGGAAYGPALTDMVVLGPQARVFVTGPNVVKSVTGESVTMEELGGSDLHSDSGLAHVMAATDDDAVDAARRLVTLVADLGTVAEEVEDRDLERHLPQRVRRAYDVGPLVEDLLDTGTAETLQSSWAPSLATVLGRFGGRTVGVLANNPIRQGGCLNAAAAEKAARFVRMCDTFGVPLLVLVDVPGYLPGLTQEREGVVRRGAKLLHAFSACSVPRLTLILRKAFGGAYVAMNARSLGAEAVFAWHSADVAVMGSVAAVRILRRRELEAVDESARTTLEEQLAREYEEETGGVERAIELGLIDRVIAGHETRSVLAQCLRELDPPAAPPVRGQVSNIPL